jgi:hypothetical protein
MAKPSNPLGTSTGIGKGEAQVFKSTYNSIFKDKLAEAEKKDKELKGAMAKASDMSQLWSRDISSFKPMVNEYQNFVKKNAKSLIKGDFDATVKNQQMMNKLTQFASSSKEAQKIYNDMLKAAILSPKKYYKKDVDNLRSFGDSNHSGDFDYSKYPLHPKIDMSVISEKLQKAVQKFGTTEGGLKYVEQKDAQGDVVGRYLKSRTSNKQLDLQSLVEGERMAAVGYYGKEQTEEEFGDDAVDNLLKTLPNFQKTDLDVKFFPSSRSSDSSEGTPEARAFPFSSKATLVNMPVAYGVKEKKGVGIFKNRTKKQLKGVLAYNNGDVNTYNPISYEAPIFHRGLPSSSAIPIKGDFLIAMLKQKEDHYIDDDKTTIGGIAESGQNFYYEDLKKGTKEADWKVQTSYMVDAFPEGYISGNGVNLSGMPIDTTSIATDEFKKNAPKGSVKRYYVALKESGTGEGKQRVLEPYHLHHDDIVQQYEASPKRKNKYLEWYEKTKQFLADQGLSQAYKDFTNQEIPSSKSSSSSKTKTKGGKQLDPNQKGISIVERNKRQAIIDKQ